jgi:hypothetical protein
MHGYALIEASLGRVEAEAHALLCRPGTLRHEAELEVPPRI